MHQKCIKNEPFPSQSVSKCIKKSSQILMHHHASISRNASMSIYGIILPLRHQIATASLMPESHTQGINPSHRPRTMTRCHTLQKDDFGDGNCRFLRCCEQHKSIVLLMSQRIFGTTKISEAREDATYHPFDRHLLLSVSPLRHFSAGVHLGLLAPHIKIDVLMPI